MELIDEDLIDEIIHGNNVQQNRNLQRRLELLADRGIILDRNDLVNRLAINNDNPDHLRGRINIVRGNNNQLVVQSGDSYDSFNSSISSEPEVPAEEQHQFNNDKVPFLEDYDQFSPFQLEIESVSLPHDNYGLFDYDYERYDKQKLTVNKSSKFYRRHKQIVSVPLKENAERKLGGQIQELFKILKVRNRYFIEGVKPADIYEDVDEQYDENGDQLRPPQQMKERLMAVVRKYGTFFREDTKREFKIKKNDIVKVGRIKMKVSKMRCNHKEK